MQTQRILVHQSFTCWLGDLHIFLILAVKKVTNFFPCNGASSMPCSESSLLSLNFGTQCYPGEEADRNHEEIACFLRNNNRVFVIVTVYGILNMRWLFVPFVALVLGLQLRDQSRNPTRLLGPRGRCGP